MRILISRLFATAALLLLLGSTVSAQQLDTWTILVYLNANNNLESEAIDNFMQMASVGSTDKIKVVVEFARLGKDGRYGAWDSTYRFFVTKGMTPSKEYAVQDIGIQDMGVGSTLANFLRWGLTNYPASHYMVVIWDHGQGWRLMNLLANSGSQFSLRQLAAERLKALRVRVQAERIRGAEPTLMIRPTQSIPNPVKASSYDDRSGHFLYNAELASSIAAAFGHTKLDVLGFDACLMGMIESAYAFKGVADYLVGSEELEPGPGWDYGTLLQSLDHNPSATDRQAADMIVTAYQTTYSSGDTPTTMSSINLSAIDALASAVNTLATSLTTELTQSPQAIQTARNACNAYGASYGYSGIDLRCFLDALPTTDDGIAGAVLATRNALANAVALAYASPNRQQSYGSHGLAIYFPPDGTWFQNDADKDAYTKAAANAAGAVYPVAFVQTNAWPDFIAAYTAKFP